MWQELGLSHADAGRDAAAIEWLERVLDFLVARQRVEPSPEGTVRLAQLHEKQGNATRALDLYSLLTQGSDVANLCVYHLEAARLLQQLELGDEARRMLARATELAPADDAALRERIAARLAELTKPA
jgi:predicted RNA polymerase sigma factor